MFKRVLVIWQEVPEFCKVYDLYVPECDYDWIIKANLKYIGSEYGNEHVERLLSYLVDKTPALSDVALTRKEISPYILENPSAVILTGFYL